MTSKTNHPLMSTTSSSNLFSTQKSISTSKPNFPHPSTNNMTTINIQPSPTVPLMSIINITDRLVLISNPFIHDNLSYLRSYLQDKYPNNQYRIYNLCIEPDMNIDQELSFVENYGFVKGYPGPLEKIVAVCSSIDNFLVSNPTNVVILHSKDGQGRCSFLAACILMHLGHFQSTSEVLRYLISKFPSLNTLPLSPSQRRYIFYYEAMLLRDQIIIPKLQLHHIRMHFPPRFSSSLISPGVSLYYRIYQLFSTKQTNNNSNQKLYNNLESIAKLVYSSINNPLLDDIPFYSSKNSNQQIVHWNLIDKSIVCQGDLIIQFYAKEKNHQVICQLAIHTSFIDGPYYYVGFTKETLDYVNEDLYHVYFDPLFQIEMIFSPSLNDSKKNNTNEIELFDENLIQNLSLDSTGYQSIEQFIV